MTGQVPRPQTYEEWLVAEGPRDSQSSLLTGPSPSQSSFAEDYRLVLPTGARLAPHAAHWFARAIVESGADLAYSDEDFLDPEGGRRDPVFKPAWSPELFQNCDYLGGAYVSREGVNPASARHVVHIPRVLVHRSAPAWYESHPSLRPPASGLVSIIICSRTHELAGECMAAIRASTDYKNYEIILIDHRAGMEFLAERFGANRVPYNEDFNFARMCNHGVLAAQGELLLFLNDDTAPLHPEWMSLMSAQAERPKVGAVGAFLTFPDGRIQHAGVYIGTPNGAGHPGRLTRGRSIWPWLRMTREQLAVTGACLMMRRSVFNEIGCFDERFPNNYNDVDLCLQCGKAGYKVILEAGARVEHRESKTRKTGIRYAERRRFLDRWAGVLQRHDPYLNPNLTDNEDLLPDPEAFARLGHWR